MPYIDTSVYVDFSDYEDEELIDELEERGYIVTKQFDNSKIEELYKEYITYGYTEKFQTILERFFEDNKI